MNDADFGTAIHHLLKELGWTHGELTPSLVHQALAQVRHLKKMAAEAERMRPVYEKAHAFYLCPTERGSDWRALMNTCAVDRGDKPAHNQTTENA